MGRHQREDLHGPRQAMRQAVPVGSEDMDDWVTKVGLLSFCSQDCCKANARRAMQVQSRRREGHLFSRVVCVCV